MKKRTKLYCTTVVLGIATLGWAFLGAAAGEKTSVDPVGTWKVIYRSTPGNSGFSPTLKVKFEGGKLTGTLNRRHNQQDVEMILQDARLQGNDISFSVRIPPVSGNGPDAIKKFQGTLAGDTIKGKVETEWAGHTQTNNWEAVRIKQ